MTGERTARLHELERRLGYRFADLGLLDRALTHASRANEEGSSGPGDNEPLEFLGDAVLGLVGLAPRGRGGLPSARIGARADRDATPRGRGAVADHD